jgi:multiple sugar transport system substrate-binding protein
MKTLEYLTVLTNAQVQQELQDLNELLEPFRAESHVDVHVSGATWGELWRDVSTIGIYRRGADVCEIGTTWLESLIAMNGLHAFQPNEIAQLGGADAFMPASWKLGIGSDGNVWGIPLRADVRVLYYWSDMVEKAGVDPHTDFQTPGRFAAAMEKLKSVVPTPLCLPTDPGSYNTLNDAATWIWGGGGDFIDPQGRRLILLDPVPRASLEAYLDLARYMPISPGGLADTTMIETFARRETAVIYGGTYIGLHLLALDIVKEKFSMIGNALPPGPSFIGGTLLVLWQHSNSHREALEFTRHLTSVKMQPRYTGLAGLLPVTRAVWEKYSTEPQYRILYEALKHGRSLSGFSLWGIVEGRLNTALGQAFADLSRHPEKTAAQAVQEHFGSLVERLNLTLSSLPGK